MDLMTYALCKGNGGGSGGDNRFVVTCTPTNPDFSGVMDKTVAEIRDAYNAGKDIVLKVVTGGTTYTANANIYVDGNGNTGFTAILVIPVLDMMMQADTGHPPEDQSSSIYYSITAYTITRAS